MPSGRTLRWFQTHADAQTVTSGGQSANELLSALTVDQRKGATITRMILQLWFRADTIDSICRVKWGIVSISEDANTASAFPDADSALDLADWLIRGAEVVLTSDVNDGSQAVRVFRDVRSQRILRGATDQTHFVVDQATSGTSVTYDVYSRILVLLP